MFRSNGEFATRDSLHKMTPASPRIELFVVTNWTRNETRRASHLKFSRTTMLSQYQRNNVKRRRSRQKISVDSRAGDPDLVKVIVRPARNLTKVTIAQYRGYNFVSRVAQFDLYDSRDLVTRFRSGRYNRHIFDVTPVFSPRLERAEKERAVAPVGKIRRDAFVRCGFARKTMIFHRYTGCRRNCAHLR